MGDTDSLLSYDGKPEKKRRPSSGKYHFTQYHNSIKSFSIMKIKHMHLSIYSFEQVGPC